jgi:4-amino-4-deoxy-L-arabinose transferase-like glycosyltransferase
MRATAFRPNGPIVVAAALAGVLIAATAFGPYGWFIDEFYYLACARHLSWGYVDHPPLSILVLAATRSALGESMTAVRLPVALAVAATVLVAARIARRLGGGPRAGWITALAVATSPMTFVMGSFFSMNAFEMLLWPLTGLVVLRLLDENQPRLWLLVGLLLGLAILNKHTSAIFGAAMIAGVLCTPARRHLLTPWPWLGGLAALAVISPNMFWQWANGWPSLEFYRNAQVEKNISTPPFQVFMSQVLFEGPGSLPVWLAGAVFLLRAPRERSWRALGVAFVLLFAMMVFSGSSRPDRIGAGYPIVFAAGAVAIERAASRRGRAWYGPAAVAMLLVSGLVVAPVTLPVVPPARAAAYTRAIGLLPPLERGKTSPIPQWLADRTGWESFVDNVAELYRTLPPEEQQRVVIFAPDYGHAGALELLGPGRGINARVISNHNTYWMWGRGLPDPQVMIAVRANQKDLELLFERVQLDRRNYCDYCMSWRNDIPIYVARSPSRSLAPIWERRKSFG